jgi:hypothetical protein
MFSEFKDYNSKIGKSSAEISGICYFLVLFCLKTSWWLCFSVYINVGSQMGKASYIYLPTIEHHCRCFRDSIMVRLSRIRFSKQKEIGLYGY